ncbi:MAG: glycosyltransferase family 4 protein [Phycisphaerales bacterium]|nr:glycosyltransferase family 4 protein [Phycisphaerales bacterium]
MRILHFIYDHFENPWGGGGGANRVWQICRHLMEIGHDCTVLTGGYPGAVDGVRHGVRYRHMAGGNSFRSSTLRYMAGVQRFLLRHGREYDVVVECFSPFNPVFSRPLAGTTTIIQLQGYLPRSVLRHYGTMGWVALAIQRAYPLLFRYAIFQTPDLGSRWPCWNQQRYWVPNGVQHDLLELPETDGSYLLYLGRLSWLEKGFDVLVEAMKVVWARHPDVQLVIAGHGKDEARIKKALHEAGNGRVRFMGFVCGQQKEEAIKHSRALLLPTRAEGYPNCVLEAAACAKPVVGSDIPELAHLKREGIGLNTTTGDAHAFAAGILRLLENPDLSGRLAARGRHWASQQSWEQTAKRYERALFSAIRGVKSAEVGDEPNELMNGA